MTRLEDKIKELLGGIQRLTTKRKPMTQLEDQIRELLPAIQRLTAKIDGLMEPLEESEGSARFDLV